MPDRADLPIIVGGTPRSGTTLLRRVLNGHSAIHCGPEVKFFDDFFANYVHDDLKNIRFFATLRNLVDEEVALTAIGRIFLELHSQAAIANGKRRWADKNPSNALFLNEWGKLLDGRLLFIHVVRNPLDTIASLKEMDFRLSVPRGVRNWVEFYKRHFDLPIRFRDGSPEKYHCVVYEEFVANPWEEVRKLMAWLGETPEEMQLNVASDRHGKGIEDPKINHRHQVDRAAVGRWKNTLTNYEAEIIWRETTDLWRKFDPAPSYWPEEPPPVSIFRKTLGRLQERLARI